MRNPTPRALLVGGAGSGKSTALAHLYAQFESDSRAAVLAHGATADLVGIPSDHVLLVDDPHLLDEQGRDLLDRRAQDPRAALIVASRPWRVPEQESAIAQRLSRHLPAVVLGYASRADVLESLDGTDAAASASCIDRILSATLGISWLVWEALQRHDPRGCPGGTAHADVERALQECIAQRLDTVDRSVRSVVEEACVDPSGHATAADEAAEFALMRAYAEGLLQRNGRPSPLVRSAVLAVMPAHRLRELTARFGDELARHAADVDGDLPDLPHDTRLAAVLVGQADRLLATRPQRATALYRAAVRCGADEATVAGRRAEAAWADGDVDGAAAIAESAPQEAPDSERLTDVAAAVWAARGMMRQADAVYRATAASETTAAARAAIPSLAVGAFRPPEAAAVPPVPSALGVSMDLLHRGLAASLEAGGAEEALSDLVRSASLYTSAGTASAICELPAVIAAVVALNAGATATAQTVLDDAIAGGHGGPWAMRRLLLWRAWVAMQRAHPAEARESLERALEDGCALSPRDQLLARALRVAIARRYESAAGLEAAWQEARGSILRTEIDLFLVHPLSELATAAARVGDADRVRPALERALSITADLGSPSLWTCQLHWAGIQRGILLNAPESLAPHAKALVAASAADPVAAAMARAGRVWTSVLAGKVDPDAVEAAAQGLSAAGMRWDAARLAGHGAARSSDRRIAARLLACARELHPADESRRVAATTGEAASGEVAAVPTEMLSEREIEVARMVLDGKTYAEIGETIFISPRTVEHHIAHIRQRLGATSRSDVLDKLRVLLGADAGAGAPQRAQITGDPA
ncbi:LuxR family transcriptional regulator [Microbacterium bovistercoris]|uniref:LuxR family transcriptional regulator n=1 Tax=Microbacterium bovistercoris TaxID=2293570 RepID=A0A371NSV0_9MICO|nr:LuxR family transcriptional regulator [Microbacterium bovistercoris]